MAEQPALSSRANAAKWILSAFGAVNRAYPDSTDWTRESPEIQRAQDDLDWALHAHFYSNIGGAPTGTLEQVRTAWRRYYRAHLPGQQKLK